MELRLCLNYFTCFRVKSFIFDDNYYNYAYNNCSISTNIRPLIAHKKDAAILKQRLCVMHIKFSS